MSKLSPLECKTKLDQLENYFENSHTFVTQILQTTILFFLLAYNEDLMIFSKNYKFHKKNMFFISIIFSFICFILSFQYFFLYYKHYNSLNDICNFDKLIPFSYKIFKYQIPIVVSFGFIIISLGLITMIFMSISN